MTATRREQLRRQCGLPDSVARSAPPAHHWPAVYARVLNYGVESRDHVVLTDARNIGHGVGVLFLSGSITRDSRPSVVWDDAPAGLAPIPRRDLTVIHRPTGVDIHVQCPSPLARLLAGAATRGLVYAEPVYEVLDAEVWGATQRVHRARLTAVRLSGRGAHLFGGLVCVCG